MTTTDIPTGRTEAFAGQAVVNTGAALFGLLLPIGDRRGTPGLYRAMARRRPRCFGHLGARHHIVFAHDRR
jgi:hypothetical protein